jgi:hypothetical protein
MTQREKNGNCFCSRAAMRQQQSVMMSCDTLVAPRLGGGAQTDACLQPRFGCGANLPEINALKRS